MAVQFAPHVPKMASDEGVIDAARAAIGRAIMAETQKPRPSACHMIPIRIITVRLNATMA